MYNKLLSKITSCIIAVIIGMSVFTVCSSAAYSSPMPTYEEYDDYYYYDDYYDDYNEPPKGVYDDDDRTIWEVFDVKTEPFIIRLLKAPIGFIRLLFFGISMWINVLAGFAF